MGAGRAHFGVGNQKVDRSEVGQEGFNLGFPHSAWMGLVVEEDEAPDPVEVLFFGFVCVVFNTQRIPDFFEQFLLWRRHNSFPLVVNE